jgi:hypothetical protein
MISERSTNLSKKGSCSKRPQSTYIPRVPQPLSPRRNWEPATPLPQASVPSTQESGGGVHTRRRGVPIPTTGEKAKYSVYSVHTNQNINYRRQITFRQG